MTKFFSGLWTRLVKGRLPMVLAGLGLTAVMAVLYLSQPSYLKRQNNNIYDALISATQHAEPTGVPVIVDLDERSLQEFGQFPWPRYRLAKLLAMIQAQGAASVTLDIVFPEEDRTSLDVLQQEMLRDLDVELDFAFSDNVPDSQALMDNDRIFASVLSQGPFVLGYNFNFEVDPRQGAAQAQSCILHPLGVAVLSSGGGAAGDPTLGIHTAPGVVCNIPELAEAVTHSGFITTDPDPDGVIRRSPLIIRFQDRLYPSLALAAFLKAVDSRQVYLTADQDDLEAIQVARIPIPVDEHGQLLVNFRGPARTFQYISAADVLNNTLAPDTFAGKIVFIGTSAAGLKDIRATPLDPVMPGVEVHATIVDNILQQDFVSRPWWMVNLEYLLVIVAGVVSTLLLTWDRSIWNILPIAWLTLLFWLPGLAVLVLYPFIRLAMFLKTPGLDTWLAFSDEFHQGVLGPSEFVILISILILVSLVVKTWAKAIWSLVPLSFLGYLILRLTWWFMDTERMFMSPLIPLATLAANYTLLTLLRFWREESEKKFFHTAFSCYVSRAVVEQVVRQPERLALAGEEKVVSILFSDLRGFTSISESLSPEQVSELLHAYFTPMTREIIKNDGTLDKFIGDAVMAFWNAPIDIVGHQDKAVLAALGMHEQLGRLNRGFLETYGLELHMGIGLHSGAVRVGNMGSADLFDYTILGDNVNLASRLEGLTKFYGLGVILSDSLRRACKGPHLFQEVDTVRVKGRELPVTVHTVYPPDQAETLGAELTLHAAALAAYKEQRFSEAAAMFEALEREHRDLPLYKEYARRCVFLKDEPPGSGWDQTYTHRSK